jgi:hypothetical protein
MHDVIRRCCVVPIPAADEETDAPLKAKPVQLDYAEEDEETD